MTTEDVIEKYNAAVAEMKTDERCQHPEAGPAYRQVFPFGDWIRSGLDADLSVVIAPDGLIRIAGYWRFNELDLLVTVLRELMTRGLGEVEGIKVSAAQAERGET
jgi:hypothetical protein